MREIKFRGKSIAGDWVYGYLSSPETINVIVEWQANESDTSDGYCEEIEVDPATVGQFTGLKDKNGAEIYEGDIIRSENGIIHTIFSVPGGFAIESNPVAFGYNSNTINPYDGLSDEQNSSFVRVACRIIGNIHDNPELLTKK